MKMKMKIKDILDINNIIFEISNIKVNSIVAYKIAKILKILASETETIEEIRMKTISPFVETNEDGSLVVNEENYTYVVKEGMIEELNQELNAFFNSEVDIELPKLKLSELDNMELTGRQMDILIPIIEE